MVEKKTITQNEIAFDELAQQAIDIARKEA
jgi:hypothetical protein